MGKQLSIYLMNDVYWKKLTFQEWIPISKIELLFTQHSIFTRNLLYVTSPNCC